MKNVRIVGCVAYLVGLLVILLSLCHIRSQMLLDKNFEALVDISKISIWCAVVGLYGGLDTILSRMNERKYGWLKMLYALILIYLAYGWIIGGKFVLVMEAGMEYLFCAIAGYMFCSGVIILMKK